MNTRSHDFIAACATVLALCAGCATPPSAAPAPRGTTQAAPPPGQSQHQWSKATEADVAAALDKKFEEAAKQFVKLKRDDQVVFCKRYRDIGSMIPQLHCITEAELRKQVEDSDELRSQMRTKVGRCVLGSGCGAGPDPVSNFPIPQ